MGNEMNECVCLLHGGSRDIIFCGEENQCRFDRWRSCLRPMLAAEARRCNNRIDDVSLSNGSFLTSV